MFLEEIRIRNYKSLGDVVLRPPVVDKGRAGLIVLAGANASGKSNVIEALGFVRDVYARGLKDAVRIGGGIDSFIRRTASGTADSVEWEVRAQEHLKWTGREDLNGPVQRLLPEEVGTPEQLFKLSHSVGLGPHGELTPHEYRVRKELLSFEPPASLVALDDGPNVVRWDQASGELYVAPREGADAFRSLARKLMASGDPFESGRYPGSFGHLVDDGGHFAKRLGRMSVLAGRRADGPDSASQAAPISSPVLGSGDTNIAAQLRFLEQRYPGLATEVVNGLYDTFPGVESVETFETDSRKLWFRLKEKGYNEPWDPTKLSQGTIKTLAALLAIHWPETCLVAIDEVEEALHTWAMEALVDRLREIAKKKMVVVSTHSEALLDHLSPEEVHVVSREDGVTRVQPLMELEPDIKRMWKEGVLLGAFLSSASLLEAVPQY